jgi:hypothetical protein
VLRLDWVYPVALIQQRGEILRFGPGLKPTIWISPQELGYELASSKTVMML